MRQVIQYQKNGVISVEDLPAPQLKPGGVLVRNECSLISAGTERSSVATAQASLIGKARTRPDLVKQVIDNARREGVVATVAKVRNRLDNYKELGYSCAGVVAASAVDDFRVGDRVACGGVGYASHAELVFVPRNLAVRIPNGVSLDEGAYATVGAIAMQSVRQADIHVGERVVVIGLGLIGLLTTQILKASGCRVMGLDVSDRNFETAIKLGCHECAISSPSSLGAVEAFTEGHGADAVIVAAATTSSEPVTLACKHARRRGTVVILGAVGMDVPRSPFYEKELQLRISCSYGPGRYDPAYEEQGHDYPYGHVRWTENRNMQSVLDLIGQRRLDVQALTTHRFPIERAIEAYELITGKTQQPYLGVLIEYSSDPPRNVATRMQLQSGTGAIGVPVLGFVGAGNHAQSYLLPPLKKLGVTLRTIATTRPVSAHSVGKKFGFAACATDAAEVMTDPSIQLAMICTRHDTHARYVLEAIRAGKNVFVEKPLAIESDQLEEIRKAWSEAARNQQAPLLMVGYNRRFSDSVRAIKSFFADAREPLAMQYRVNAGFLPSANWYQAPDQGGRVVGEIGHFIDTMQFLAGADPVSVYAVAPWDASGRYSGDNVQVSLSFSDGSIGQISYLANGASAMPKERIEVFGAGRAAVLDNFRDLELYDGRKRSRKRYNGDKGHAAEMQAVLDALKSGTPPIRFDSLMASTRASLAIVQALRSREKADITLE
jgi:polar amino acid transport system substrate-binding protein